MRSDPAWQVEWEEYFALSDDADISGSTLAGYRSAYDELVSAMVRDLNISRARAQYTTDLVSLNASAPTPEAVQGRQAQRS